MKPLAYHITWTTHGSWLPGDERGWVDGKEPGIQSADPGRKAAMQARMKEPPVYLTEEQRAIVDAVIRRHCEIRGWHLHAINVRTNHVHVVVTADLETEAVMEQFKAWASRRLSESAGQKHKWWTEHGSTKWINDESYLANATRYVNEMQ